MAVRVVRPGLSALTPFELKPAQLLYCREKRAVYDNYLCARRGSNDQVVANEINVG